MSFIRKEWKASYTVEAAFVVPILLSAMLVEMLIGLDLYEDVKGEQEQEKIMQMWHNWLQNLRAAAMFMHQVGA